MSRLPLPVECEGETWSGWKAGLVACLDCPLAALDEEMPKNGIPQRLP